MTFAGDTVAASGRGNDPDRAEARAFRDLLVAVAKTWRIPVIFGLLVLLSLVALILFLRGAIATTSTYVARIGFMFPGTESGTFPNGLPFTINEIADPAILALVYDRLKLDQYKLKPDDFYNGFSVRPYAPTELDIAERFRLQLSDRRLTFAERERLEGQLKTRLDQASRTAAELTFTIRSRFGIPDEVGRAIVNSVPQAWSQAMIEKKGVLRIPGFSASQVAIDPEVVRKLSLPVAIVVLTQASQRLFARIEELRSVTGLAAVHDAETGRSFRDLERDVRDIALLKVGGLRRSLVLYGFKDERNEILQLVDRRIRDLALLESDYLNKIDAIGEALSRYVNAVVGLRGRAFDRRGSAVGADSSAVTMGSPTIPQLSEGFIDRIIELSGKGKEDDQKYILMMTQRQLELNERLIGTRGELSQWRELLAAMRDDDAGKETLSNEKRKEIVEDLHNVIAAVNQNWAALTRLESEFAANRVGHTARLYMTYAIPRDVIQMNPVWNLTNFVLVFSAAFLAMLGVWGIRALLYWNRMRPAPLPTSVSATE